MPREFIDFPPDDAGQQFAVRAVAVRDCARGGLVKLVNFRRNSQVLFARERSWNHATY